MNDDLTFPIPKKGKDITVSIVMPSFNQVEFIEAAISSVQQQTTACFELIVIDGGSTDGTLGVLERMSAKAGSRLKWLSEKDNGPAHAINKAFKMAKGEIIGWLNSDDLYHPLAIERAVEHFRLTSSNVMVYGTGRHIDMRGDDSGLYPSIRPPVASAMLRSGCPVCQPTVFIRREILKVVGYLDEQLKTAFDYDFWLRIFEKYPEQIGFVEDVQAYSRMHAGSITMRMRSLVALEGMQITANRFGSASPHWFYTYLDEFFATHPFLQGKEEQPSLLFEQIENARTYLSDTDRENFDKRLRNDARVKLLTADAFIGIYPDGWVPPVSILRIKAQSKNWTAVILECRNANPRSASLRIRIKTNLAVEKYLTVDKIGRFQIRIKLPSWYEMPACWSFKIQTDDFFIPAEVETGSDDRRNLGFIVENIRLIG
jgi:hypothetical protein